MNVKAKPEYGLVLSGGGARGLAHIGVIAALEDHGISPGVISGSSMGAIAERVYRLAIYQHVEKNFAKCDYIIDPPELRQHGIFDFKHVDQLYEIGYNAAKALIITHSSLSIKN